MCFLQLVTHIIPDSNSKDKPKQAGGIYLKTNRTFAVKGNLLFSKSPNEIISMDRAYLICEDGVSKGVFSELPAAFSGISVRDFGENLVIPGLTDLHLHAPQFAYRGLGMDMELLEWLNANAFPEEAKYKSLEYAARAYGIFVDALVKSATTRAAIFATVHPSATLLLMDLLEKAGMKAAVGKVNMDRNAPDFLCEASAQKSADDTLQWIRSCQGRYQNIIPILTPRFAPSCTDELFERLSDIQKETGVGLQSHLSENDSEIAFVAELFPESAFYGAVYDFFGLFGGGCHTIMAHCVHSSRAEIDLMKKQGVYIAHCPQSNTNIASGIAPASRYLDEGLHIGLGSDIAGGFSLSIFRAMSDAVQVSKLRWKLQDDTVRPITVAEAFYMGTIGGGSYFGKVGSFAEGYEFDAVVLDDSMLAHPQELSSVQRLERLIFCGNDNIVKEKFIAGKSAYAISM